MTKKEILDYIIETPGNTNRAVLGDMLDSFEGGSGGGSGGDSDFVKANIRFARSSAAEVRFYLSFVDEEGNAVGFHIFEEDGVRHISEEHVEDSVGTDQEYAQVVAYIMSGAYLMARPSGDATIESISGDAELADVVRPGASQPIKIAKIYGDCTISIDDSVK